MIVVEPFQKDFSKFCGVVRPLLVEFGTFGDVGKNGKCHTANQELKSGRLL